MSMGRRLRSGLFSAGRFVAMYRVFPVCMLAVAGGAVFAVMPQAAAQDAPPAAVRLYNVPDNVPAPDEAPPRRPVPLTALPDHPARAQAGAGVDPRYRVRAPAAPAAPHAPAVAAPAVPAPGAGDKTRASAGLSPDDAARAASRLSLVEQIFSRPSAPPPMRHNVVTSPAPFENPAQKSAAPPVPVLPEPPAVPERDGASGRAGRGLTIEGLLSMPRGQAGAGAAGAAQQDAAKGDDRRAPAVRQKAPPVRVRGAVRASDAADGEGASSGVLPGAARGSGAGKDSVMSDLFDDDDVGDANVTASPPPQGYSRRPLPPRRLYDVR